MFTASQVALYDQGLNRGVPFVWLRLACGDIYLTSATGPGHPATLGVPLPDSYTLAVPAVLSWGQAQCGFDLITDRDQVATMQITAQNVQIPFNTQPSGLPNPVIRGKLSDYLASVTLQGPAGSLLSYPPGFCSVYIGAPQDSDGDRHYLYRGLLVKYSVQDDGRNVVMRFVEDTRWDRSHPYPISRKNFQTCPQEDVGIHQPINYGNFGLWAHKDFPDNGNAALGPFTENGPWFPACANLAVAHRVLNLYNSTQQWHSSYSAGLSRPSLGLASMFTYNVINGNRFQAAVLASELPALVVHDDDGGNGVLMAQQALNDISGIWPTSEGGSSPPPAPQPMHDLKWWNNMTLAHEVIGVAFLLPTREVTTSLVGSTNLSSIFSVVHRKRSAQHMIDGDRWSWFKDDVSSTTTRRVVYELGTWPNMGAIKAIHACMFGRRRSGSGGMNVAIHLDYLAAPVVSPPDTGTLSTGTMPVSVMPTGFFGVSGQLTGVLTKATSAERWEFVQHDVGAPLGGQPMRLTVEWTKATGADVWDLIQVGLMIEFDPSRYFMDYRVVTDDRVVESYTAGGRKQRTTVDVSYLQKVIGASAYQSNRHVYLTGLGYMAEPGPFPGDPAYLGAPSPTIPNIVHNPAEIIRHLIYTQGGGSRDDIPPSWPTVALDEFEYNGTSRHDFLRAEQNLDAACQEACGNPSETFKVAVSLPQWSTVRAAANAVAAGVPGLKYFRLPNRSNQDGSSFRGSFGCVWPLVGETPNYRRAVNLKADAIRFDFDLTEESLIMNDIRLKYGYSSVKGTYQRELWANNNVLEHGWPFSSRNSGSLESDAGDSLAGTMGIALEDSYSRYGTRTFELALPWVYRWQEALAIRNWLIRWHAFQRVRLDIVARPGISDLLPGDVFQIDNSSDHQLHMGLTFPLRHITDGPLSWGNTTWLVESVVYDLQSNGELQTHIRAIYNGKLSEV